MRQLFARSNSPAQSPERMDDPDGRQITQAIDDPQAFGALFDKYWEAIFKFCYYHTGDWHQAEDAASEIFVKALANLRNFDPNVRGTTFRAWLYGIARNVIATGYRQAARAAQSPLHDQLELVSPGATVEELIVAAEQHAEVRALLAQLPPDQRELLELRMAGLNAAEIGRALGRSHESVRKAQSRAIISLRDALNQQRRQAATLDGKRNG